MVSNGQTGVFQAMRIPTQPIDDDEEGINALDFVDETVLEEDYGNQEFFDVTVNYSPFGNLLLFLETTVQVDSATLDKLREVLFKFEDNEKVKQEFTANVKIIPNTYGGEIPSKYVNPSAFSQGVIKKLTADKFVNYFPTMCVVGGSLATNAEGDISLGGKLMSSTEVSQIVSIHTEQYEQKTYSLLLVRHVANKVIPIEETSLRNWHSGVFNNVYSNYVRSVKQAIKSTKEVSDNGKGPFFLNPLPRDASTIVPLVVPKTAEMICAYVGYLNLILTPALAASFFGSRTLTPLYFMPAFNHLIDVLRIQNVVGKVSNELSCYPEVAKCVNASEDYEKEKRKDGTVWFHSASDSKLYQQALAVFAVPSPHLGPMCKAIVAAFETDEIQVFTLILDKTSITYFAGMGAQMKSMMTRNGKDCAVRFFLIPGTVLTYVGVAATKQQMHDLGVVKQDEQIPVISVSSLLPGIHYAVAKLNVLVNPHYESHYVYVPYVISGVKVGGVFYIPTTTKISKSVIDLDGLNEDLSSYEIVSVNPYTIEVPRHTLKTENPKGRGRGLAPRIDVPPPAASGPRIRPPVIRAPKLLL